LEIIPTLVGHASLAKASFIKPERRKKKGIFSGEFPWSFGTIFSYYPTFSGPYPKDAWAFMQSIAFILRPQIIFV
jgi:hypothetical protein